MRQHKYRVEGEGRRSQELDSGFLCYSCVTKTVTKFRAPLPALSGSKERSGPNILAPTVILKEARGHQADGCAGGLERA